MTISLPKIRDRIYRIDVSIIYNRISIDRHSRKNSISKDEIFPPIDGYCFCGCGTKLPPYRIKWANDECREFSFYVWSIISGRTNEIKEILRNGRAPVCCKCGSNKRIEVDHVVPVSSGGGGCWITGYQLLCYDCHKAKTGNDTVLIAERKRFNATSI